MTTPGDIRAVKMLENQSAPTSLSLEAGELLAAAAAAAAASTIKTRTEHLNNNHHQPSTSSHNYYRKLLTPLLIITTLLAELHQASGAEFNKIQKRYSVMQDPSQLLSSAQATPETDSEQHARQLANQRRQLVSLAMANILHKNQVAQQQQQQQRSLWTQDPSPAFHHHHQQQQQQQAEQFVSYRPMVAASTMPTINRQIQPPNPFYELSFAPTNTLQIEHQHDSASANNNQDNHHQHQPQLDEHEPHFASAMSQPSPVRLEPPSQQQQQQQDLQAAGTTARSIELPHEQAEQQQHQQSEVNQMTSETNGSNNNNKGGESARNSQQPDLQQQQQPPASVDKIEPRQRRRLFNRILKKAEWNHLFVELSKVFLKYFLDLALKDIIGKQSGSTSSSSGSETTSRKKLDAQSELADLLKEFVKNAISNI